MVVPQNGWFLMESPLKMDDLGENPLFSETSIYILPLPIYQPTKFKNHGILGKIIGLGRKLWETSIWFFHWHLRVHEAEATSKLNKIAGKAAGPRRVRCHKHRRQAPGERTRSHGSLVGRWLVSWKFGNHTVDGRNPKANHLGWC